MPRKTRKHQVVTEQILEDDLDSIELSSSRQTSFSLFFLILIFLTQLFETQAKKSNSEEAKITINSPKLRDFNQYKQYAHYSTEFTEKAIKDDIEKIFDQTIGKAIKENIEDIEKVLGEIYVGQKATFHDNYHQTKHRVTFVRSMEDCISEDDVEGFIKVISFYSPEEFHNKETYIERIFAENRINIINFIIQPNFIFYSVNHISTCLSFAIKYYRHDIFDRLVEDKFLVLSFKTQIQNSFIYAAYCRNIHALKYFLSLGIKPKYQILVTTLQIGDIEISDLLIDAQGEEKLDQISKLISDIGEIKDSTIKEKMRVYLEEKKNQLETNSSNILKYLGMIAVLAFLAGFIKGRLQAIKDKQNLRNFNRETIQENKPQPKLKHTPYSEIPDEQHAKELQTFINDLFNDLNIINTQGKTTSNSIKEIDQSDQYLINTYRFNLDQLVFSDTFLEVETVQKQFHVPREKIIFGLMHFLKEFIPANLISIDHQQITFLIPKNFHAKVSLVGALNSLKTFLYQNSEECGHNKDKDFILDNKKNLLEKALKLHGQFKSKVDLFTFNERFLVREAKTINETWVEIKKEYERLKKILDEANQDNLLDAKVCEVCRKTFTAMETLNSHTENLINKYDRIYKKNKERIQGKNSEKKSHAKSSITPSQHIHKKIIKPQLTSSQNQSKPNVQIALHHQAQTLNSNSNGNGKQEVVDDDVKTTLPLTGGVKFVSAKHEPEVAASPTAHPTLQQSKIVKLPPIQNELDLINNVLNHPEDCQHPFLALHYHVFRFFQLALLYSRSGMVQISQAHYDQIHYLRNVLIHSFYQFNSTNKFNEEFASSEHPLKIIAKNINSFFHPLLMGQDHKAHSHWPKPKTTHSFDEAPGSFQLFQQTLANLPSLPGEKLRQRYYSLKALIPGLMCQKNKETITFAQYNADPMISAQLTWILTLMRECRNQLVGTPYAIADNHFMQNLKSIRNRVCHVVEQELNEEVSEAQNENFSYDPVPDYETYSRGVSFMRDEYKKSKTTLFVQSFSQTNPNMNQTDFNPSRINQSMTDS